MYSDLSLIPINSIDINHLLTHMQEYRVTTAAIDYEFKDDLITPQPPQTYARIKESAKGVSVYSRATLIIEQSHTLHQLNQGNPPNYDLIAVSPRNEKMFHAICCEYENYDVISLDLSEKLPFMLKRNPVYEAIRKGKFFEIQYHALFKEQTRVVCMTNIINLIKATGGKNLIVSSHAEGFKSHRTPYDVAALLVTLGLDKNKALATMKDNTETVLKSAIHRRCFKGTVKQLSEVVVRKLGKRIQKHRDNLRKALTLKQKQ